MKRCTWQGLAAAGVFFLCQSLWQPPLAAQQLQVSRGLAQYFSLVQFSIEAGRIHSSSVHTGRSISSSSTGPGAHRSEQLTINITGRVPSVKYEASVPEYQLSLEFSGGDQVRLRRTPRGDSELPGIEFDQAPHNDLTLVVYEGQQRQTHSAKTIWHLLITQPELCQEHLVPLLELVHADLQLTARAAAIESALIARAAVHDDRHDDRWPQLVAALGSDRFATRRAAERELLRGGQRAVAVLEGLSLEKLDAEQRFRVRRLIEQLTGDGGDRPHRVASRLGGDPTVWLSLLDRPDLQYRQAAAEQLARLLQREIEFDPEAAPEVRAAQIEKLREQMARN